MPLNSEIRTSLFLSLSSRLKHLKGLSHFNISFELR